MNLHRKYIRRSKKNTLTLLLTMALSITLLVSLFTLFHTNHRVASKQNQFIYSSIDYQLSNITSKEIDKIKDIKGIEHLGISRNSAMIYTENRQRVTLLEANTEETLTVSKLVEGRMPKEKNEIIAEKWALLNMGINPKLNSKVTLDAEFANNGEFEEKKEIEYKIVGILNDMAFNKRSGSVFLYTSLDNKIHNDFRVTVKWKENLDKDVEMKKLMKELDLSKDQLSKNIWDENKSELLKNDIQLGFLLMVIFSVTLYGVFRIFFISRESQYGILRAIGFKNHQIRKLILKELLEIYLMSVPIGLAFGLLISYLVTYISKDRELKVYFWGKSEEFSIVFPYIQIGIGIILVGMMITIIGYFFAVKINNKTIIDIIFGHEKNKDKSIKGLDIVDKKKSKVLQILSFKYMYRHRKSTIFLIISLIFGSILFYGLGYQGELEKLNSDIGKEMNYYNGDYLVTSNDDMSSNIGIKEETFKKMKKLSGVYDIETQKAMPIKVFNDGVRKNEAFFKEGDKLIKEIYGFSLTNHYEEEEIYLTKMKGYNNLALEKLKKYVVDGSFIPENIKKNEVILIMPRMVEKGKSKGVVGYFKEGRAVMNYKVGDEIEIAYKKDYNTEAIEYWQGKDTLKDYKQRSMKVIAIAYYPYMNTISPLEQNYPLFVTSEEQYSSIIPLNLYETMNVRAEEGINQRKLEYDLIDLAVKNKNITARSMIEEKENIERIYIKRMTYIYGISIITLILILINLINGLQYRINIRKTEFATYRALGMTQKSISDIVCFENRVLGILSLGISFIVTYLISPLIFERSELFLYGINYKYNYILFGIIIISTLIICEVLSRNIVRQLKKDNLIEELNKTE